MRDGGVGGSFGFGDIAMVGRGIGIGWRMRRKRRGFGGGGGGGLGVVGGLWSFCFCEFVV